MCGIIGFTGFHKAQPILLEGLKRLEYRGYDSAGIAYFRDNTTHISIRKTAAGTRAGQRTAAFPRQMHTLTSSAMWR